MFFLLGGHFNGRKNIKRRRALYRGRDNVESTSQRPTTPTCKYNYYEVMTYKKKKKKERSFVCLYSIFSLLNGSLLRKKEEEKEEEEVYEEKI